MSGPIVRSGPSVKFTTNWEQAFAGGKPAKKAAPSAKASSKAKAKAKPAAKSKKKPARKKS